MFRLICFLVFVCLLVVEANASIQSRLPSMIAIRGGASKSKASRKTSPGKASSKSKRGKSSLLDDDDDNDNGDEDDDIKPIKKSKSKPSSKKSSSSSSGKSKSGKKGRMELVPVKSKKGKRKSASMFPALPVNINLQEKLSDMTKQGQSIYKDIYRRAKVLRSSPFEGMLLKATWPGPEPIAPEILNEIVRHSIPAFKYGSSSNSEDDPYHMTLHKLWTKMTEKDWRVVVKATFILHCVSRDSSTDTCEKFASAIKSMSRIRNPKKPTHKYFDLRLMNDLDATSEVYQDFVTQYAKYVLYRAKMFSGKFEELKRLEESDKIKNVVAQMKKAKQCITLGLGCAVSGKDFAKPVLGQSIKTLSLDLRDIWKAFSSKVSILLAYEPEVILTATTATVGTAPSAPSDKSSPDSQASTTPNPLDKDVAELLEFYKSTETKISEFLSKHSKLYLKLKIKIPTELEPSEVDAAKVSDKIGKLTSIRGGASDDDDDEDDDDDDDDGEEDGDEDDAAADDDEDDDEDSDTPVKSHSKKDDDDEEDDDAALEKELDSLKEDDDDDDEGAEDGDEDDSSEADEDDEDDDDDGDDDENDE